LSALRVQGLALKHVSRSSRPLGETTLLITRRGAMLASTATLLGAAPFARPALAQSSPILIGWLAALTGPSSAPAIGFDRGAKFATDEINAAGGVKGRKIELVTRDTQGDPTKAVNAAQDMIGRQKVSAIWGPTNSGEALATNTAMARAKMPNMHPCVVDSLIDPVKYPNAFRIAPSNGQWDDAVRNYCLNVLKVKDVAVVGDTTGYGVSAVAASVAAFKKDGANVVYQAQIDATQPDVTPDMLRMTNAGAKIIVVWSVATGMEARLMNERAALGWDAPIVGHPALGSGDVRQLLEKEANWGKVYMAGYASCSYDENGKLPPRSADFVARLAGKVSLQDSSLWWVAAGYDAIKLVAEAVNATGSSTSDAIIGYWNSLLDYPGVFGTYSWTPTQHNGYPTKEVVMSQANSQKDGAFKLAPGYA
jgi:branched-chain amino acid transport system substrate-binding protein